MKHTRLPLIAAQLGVAALIASIGIAAPAYADSETSQLVANPTRYIDHSGVVHYQFDPVELPGAIVRVDAGTSTDGSCQFTGTGSGSAKDAPTIEVGSELTFDPATCTRQIAVGKYELSNAPASVLATLNIPKGMITDSVIDTAASAQAALSNWYGMMNARVQDPIGIHVSETEAEHTWNSGGVVSHHNRWGWYSPTGWSRTSSSTLNTSIATNTRGTFQNIIFCNPFAATYTNHSRTEFRGYTSGLWDWCYTMSKSGDCAELLSYHYSVIAP
ncbi:MAG: hypothetical protein KDB18_03035 [Salinibacterium sp.]|nr:hypothetical protein [Salinibacterium sp.]